MLPKLIVISAIISIFVFMALFLPMKKDAKKPVVFFGDSITAGQGAELGQDFPSLIGKKLNIPIVNAGVSGNKTQDALLRIDHDVLSKNPAVVVIELGINDLLFNLNAQTTTKNFESILSRIKPTGAKIVILGVKFVLFQKTYETNWQDLATKYNATYVPDILDGIINDQNLKYDDIHPDAKGYQKIAEKLSPIIAPLTLKPNN
jgi:lysophospholipase L1-like esterase